MMDLQNAIRLLEQEHERAQKMCFVRNPLAWALYRVWKKADGQKDRDDNCMWIPVTEKLPPHCVTVLSYNGAGIGTDFYDKTFEVWCSDMDRPIPTVTHWMPLPEPPEGRKDNV